MSLRQTHGADSVRAAAGAHGTETLCGWFGGYGIVGTEQFLASKLGLPPWVAMMAGLVEFGGGLLLALGLVTRVAAAIGGRLDDGSDNPGPVVNGFFWTRADTNTSCGGVCWR